MSLVHDGQATCSMCLEAFDLRRAKPVLQSRPLRTRDVFQCPHCGYLVAVPREVVTAAP